MANRKTAAAKRSNGGGTKGSNKETYSNTGLSKKEYKRRMKRPKDGGFSGGTIKGGKKKRKY